MKTIQSSFQNAFFRYISVLFVYIHRSTRNKTVELRTPLKNQQSERNSKGLKTSETQMKTEQQFQSAKEVERNQISEEE